MIPPLSRLDSNFKSRAFIIFLVVSAYWIVSILLVFVNKHVLSLEELDAPIFISWLQCLITIVCVVLTNSFFKLRKPSQTFRVSFPVDTYIQVLHLSAIFVAMIMFNNLTLKLVPLSFYNVARALTTIFNMIFTRVILGETISLRACICCLGVVFGFLLGVTEEIKTLKNLSFVSLLMGVSSSIFVSLFAIYSKPCMERLNNNQWSLQMVNNVNAALLFVPLIPIVGEFSILVNKGVDIYFSPRIWASILVSGILGFLIGICTNFQIKYTSPLTHNISGTAKACFQTIIAVIVFKEGDHSLLWWLSNLMVLVGSACYSYTRGQEMLVARSRLK